MRATGRGILRASKIYQKQKDHVEPCTGPYLLKRYLFLFIGPNIEAFGHESLAFKRCPYYKWALCIKHLALSTKNLGDLRQLE